MALLCSVHNVEFKNFVEEHELCIGEDLRKNVDFILADPPYDTRRDWTDDHGEYDVFGMNNIKYMDKVIGDVLK